MHYPVCNKLGRNINLCKSRLNSCYCMLFDEAISIVNNQATSMKMTSVAWYVLRRRRFDKKIK